jgi:hypothetical protein
MTDRIPYLKHQLELNKNNTVAVIRKDDLKWAVKEIEWQRSFKNKVVDAYRKYDHPAILADKICGAIEDDAIAGDCLDD